MRVDDLKKHAVNDKQKKLEKRKKLLITIFSTFMFAIIVLIVWIILFKNTSRINVYEDSRLKFKFDSSWTLSRSNSDNISLVHKTKSFIDIKISKLLSNNLNDNMESFADEVKFDIKKQNSSYKLIKEDQKIVSKNMYIAYRMLYESDDTQCLVVILRKDDYLFIVNYTSKDEYFDILLNNFEVILSSFELR